MLDENADISDAVAKAKLDIDYRNNFIKEHEKFILASSYKAVGHFVNKTDDEYSIALIAFDEAINSFSPDKGDFRAFASLVIKRRLFDYIKSEARHSSEIAVDDFSGDLDLDEDNVNQSLNKELRKKETELSKMNSEHQPESSKMKDEIDAVTMILSEYGFSFWDLAKCSPKAEKTKTQCAIAVGYMLENQQLLETMRLKKVLPIKEIKNNSKVPRKILERHRKYIIAAIEILAGDYPLLGEYMINIRKEDH